MKTENYKLTIWVICLLGYLFIGLFSKASAEAISLRLSPTLIQIKAVTPSEISSPLTIENISEASVTLNVQLKLFKGGPNQNGQLEYLDDKENQSDFFNKIHILDNPSVHSASSGQAGSGQVGTEIKELTLGPKQKKDLLINISIPENEKPTDHYFSIVFITKSSLKQVPNSQVSGGQSSFSAVNGGISSNILLSIVPKNMAASVSEQPTAIIEEFSAPVNVQSGPLPFNVKIKNTGSHFISPKGTITITNMFGQRIGKVEIPAQNILANSSRYLVANQVSSQQSAVSSKTAVWPEKFLIGPYTAELNLEVSPTGPVLKSTTPFTALPFQQIAIILLAIVVFLVIKKRVKTKMSDR